MVSILTILQNAKIDPNKSYFNMIYHKYQSAIEKSTLPSLKRYQNCGLDINDFVVIKLSCIRKSLELWDTKTGEEGFAKLLVTVYSIMVNNVCKNHSIAALSSNLISFDTTGFELKEFDNITSKHESGNAMDEYINEQENNNKFGNVLKKIPTKLHDVAVLKFKGYKNREIREILKIDDKKLRSKINSITKYTGRY